MTGGWQTFSTDEEFPTGPTVLKGDLLLESGFQEGSNPDVLEIISEILGSRRSESISVADLEGALVHFHGRNRRRVSIWLYPKEGLVRMIESFASEDVRTMAETSKPTGSGYK